MRSSSPLTENPSIWREKEMQKPSSSTLTENSSSRKWRFTWETFAHLPTLRLFLFNPEVFPSAQCKNLRSSLDFKNSVLLVAWIAKIEDVKDGENSSDFLLRVPVPRVLIDPGSSVDSAAHDDHIEVKIALILPVDYPLAVAGLDSVLDLTEEDTSERERRIFNRLLPLSLGSDLKNLSSKGADGGVHFYCKRCSVKLTKEPLRSFVEMPSVNWRDVADNWFGACCCSFGGVSERLVSEYINSNVCAEGACLIDGTSVTISKNDLVECRFPDLSNGEVTHEPKFSLVTEADLSDAATEPGSQGKVGLCGVNDSEGIFDICQTLSRSSLADEMPKLQNPSCYASLSAPDCSEKGGVGTDCCFVKNNDIAHLSLNKAFGVSDRNSMECTSKATSGGIGRPCRVSSTDELSMTDHCCIAEVQCLVNHAEQGSTHGVSTLSMKNGNCQANLNHLQVGSIGGGFMIRNVHLPKDIMWAEFLCHQCSSLLGSYPFVEDDHAPVDGGIRLFKCCVSTSLPVGGSGDMFRNHTLQRVFVNQLLEIAVEELSFRTVIRDLKTKSPMLQIVILNSKAWCSTGFCLDAENGSGPVSKIDLHPVVKVLYSDCSNASAAELRRMEEWATKSHADETYMMQCQIKELIEFLKSAQDGLPNSCSFIQGFSLSSMER